MACRVLVDPPDGSTIEARALLDSASSAFVVSERLAQTLCLPRTRQNTKISGVAGLSHTSPLQSIATLKLSSKGSPYQNMEISAIVVPRVKTNSNLITSHHVSVTRDDLLCLFWQNEEEQCLTSEERSVLQNFKENHYRSQTGRFVVHLPKKPRAKPLGKSRSQAVRRFLPLKRSLHSIGQFEAFREVM